MRLNDNQLRAICTRFLSEQADKDVSVLKNELNSKIQKRVLKKIKSIAVKENDISVWWDDNVPSISIDASIELEEDFLTEPERKVLREGIIQHITPSRVNEIIQFNGIKGTLEEVYQQVKRIMLAQS